MGTVKRRRGRGQSEVFNRVSSCRPVIFFTSVNNGKFTTFGSELAYLLSDPYLLTTVLRPDVVSFEGDQPSRPQGSSPRG